MSKASMPKSLRLLALVVAACALVLASAITASAATVHLRIEGATKTQFNGDVTTNGRSVPGGVDRPECRSTTTARDFPAANGLTAVADALGEANMSTSGTQYGWGTMLCSANGEFPASTTAGWLFRLNQQDSTTPNGYVTGTDPLSNGDSLLIYMSPSYGYFTSSLELKLPNTANPGVPVTGYVDSYDTGTDVKSTGPGAAISGGGASSTSGADGSFSITFPTAGKFLVTAERDKSIRGSQWVTVSEAAQPAPVLPPTQKQVNQQRRIAARAKCRATFETHKGLEFRLCIRTANQMGRNLTSRQRRINARARCVINYPTKGSSNRTRCIRDANRIGR